MDKISHYPSNMAKNGGILNSLSAGQNHALRFVPEFDPVQSPRGRSTWKRL